MAVWIVRGGSSRGLHEEEFLESSSIGIFFGAEEDLTVATEDEIRRDIRQYYIDDLEARGKEMSPSRIEGIVTYYINQVLLFRDSIKPGDTVLMPRKETGGRMVAVGTVTSSYEFWDGKNYRHRRGVKWEQESVPREQFPFEWYASDQRTVFCVG